MRPPVLIGVLGPTATGKSALGIALAERFDGEIISCDSAAIYRGFDIGTDKVPAGAQRGIPHHLVDVAEPTRAYSAADYARDASAACRAIRAAGRLPIVVGGTGFYFRALTRGLFPGPGRDVGLRDRLVALASRHGVEFLHRMVGRVDPESALRILPRDRMRLVRALEVFFLTGKPLTDHFRQTVSPLSGWHVVPVGLTLPASELAVRLRRRVDAQFDAGLLDEIRGLIAGGVPEEAHPFHGLVYQQALELLHGVRGEEETRELIARENRRYARRQLIWFRKEPNLKWFEGPGDSAATIDAVVSYCEARYEEAGSLASDGRGD